MQPAPAGQLEVGNVGRIYQVSNCLVRGPQLTQDEFTILKAKYHVTAIIKMNVPWLGFDGPDDEPADGMTIYRIPLPPFGPITHDQTERVQKAIADECLAGGVVYLHCLHGEDRTGYEVAIYRVRHGSWAKYAFAEAIAYGFHDGEVNKPALDLMVESYEKETGWRR